jgi:hypothetical protein
MAQMLYMAGIAEMSLRAKSKLPNIQEAILFAHN